MQSLKPGQEVAHENIVPSLGVTPSLKENSVPIFIAHTLVRRVVNEDGVHHVNGRHSAVIGKQSLQENFHAMHFWPQVKEFFPTGFYFRALLLA